MSLQKHCASYATTMVTTLLYKGMGYTQYNGHALPTLHLEGRLRARVTSSDLRQSIAVVEEFSRPEKELIIPFPPEYHKALEKGLRPGFHIMSAWGRLSAGAHLQVVVEVRSRLLEFMLQLEEKVPEQLDGVSFKDLATQIGVGNMFKGAVFGDNVNINIGSGSQSHMTSSVVKNDLASLMVELRKQGVDEADLADLDTAIAEDALTSADKPEIGPSVKGWIGKTLSKAGTAAWDVSVQTAAAVLGTAVSAYYGIGK
ncbi:AbiTii (plasmid) [Caballeronia sp. SBC1]|uniref:AbiTii domain-containing protein n=1 Tax=unclassified Caballeronia TaxID=2646786 RepID=UPI0013E13F9F|nr:MULTISPECIES: hypothetical protein [unclassified Caballeronia]QIE29512.1 AbiTii [Caballeronia sp. SBC2]QIN67767.1 AbiTii [Caballeronia sp. SBC1]